MKNLLIMISLFIILTGCSNSNANDETVAVVKDGYQEVTVNVSARSYQDITVQKGIPVKINFKVTENNLNGCNNKILIKEWQISQKLSDGDNIVEFTPEETGTYEYTCWMNMIRNTITVVDSIK